MFIAGNCNSKQLKCQISMFIAGNCRSKCLHFFSIFGTCVLAYGIQHLFLGIYFLAYIVCFKKHFVSISSVTFWHLYSTHAFKGATMQLSILARSDLRNSNPTEWKYPIACAPEYSRNLLFHFYFYFHFILKMFCFATMVADNCHSSRRHKFVNFRLNFNYIALKIKQK